MRKQAAAIGSLTLSLCASPVLAAPVPTEYELRLACSYGKPSVVACLERKAANTSIELRHAENAVRTQLRNVDDWPRFVALARRRFVESQRAYLRYRAVQCEFFGSLVGAAAGSGAKVMRPACVATLNATRARELRAAAKFLAGK